MNELIAEEHMGYSLFVEVENRMLKAFNQWNVLSNMRENNLLGVMESYINKLSKEDQLGLAIITEYIRQKGLEETRRELTVEGVYVG